MTLRIVICMASALYFLVACVHGKELFEDTVAVEVLRGPRGPRGMPGDIVALNDGSLLMSFTKDGGIMGIKSSDAGKTWGDSFTLVAKPAKPAKGRYAHPSFLRLNNDHILMSYIYTTSPTTPYFGYNFVRRSADEGKTWTDQFLMTPYSGYAAVHNDKLLELSSGRIVAMGHHKAHFPSSRDHSGYVGLAFYSDDLGHSWQSSKNFVDMQPVEVQEADAVELKDGRVMMFARSYSGHPVRAYSSDQCETWSEGELIKELKMPYAGLPTVKRIPSTDDLLFIWNSEKSTDKNNHQIRRRSALTTAISQDEGKTFSHIRYIAKDPEEDFGYQAVEFVGDDLAVIAYHARDGLHVARIGIDWFYGK